ncbi:ACP S-malonyltransferase [bacterium]|nr:ACP S-malonyltransferase [bacterium]MCP5462498.1 ACP S-malonyltransferase [bacterium]
MKKFAVIFPGQGAQYIGMGKGLFEHKFAVEVMKKANDILGFDLKKLCLEGPLELLTQTDNSQVALYTCGYIAYRLLMEQLPTGCTPVVTAGLSLGEFTALAAAEVYSFEDGLRLVRKRGTLMQQACIDNPGTMASIMGAERDAVDVWVEEAKQKKHIIATANLNCPGQVVISGTVEGVAFVAECAEKNGFKAVPLNVSGAFHSPLMESARKGLAEAITLIDFSDPILPVFSNCDAILKSHAQEIKKALVDQMVNSVLWQSIIEQISAMDVSLFIELGCGKVLKGLLRRIDRSAECISVEAVEDISNLTSVLFQKVS